MKNKENYLERCPERTSSLKWSIDEQGLVTLEIENKGIFNKIAQKLLKKPKISYVHLDEFGSFVWQHIDGKNDIIAIGKCVESQFGEKANPLYERLIKYFGILESYGFIKWNEQRAT